VKKLEKRYGYTKEELSVFEADRIIELQDGKTIDKDLSHEMVKNALHYADTKRNIWKYYVGKEAVEFESRELSN